MKQIVILLIVILLSFNFSNSNDNFVSVVDNQFILNGKPYYYFGTNFWHGAYLAADLVEGDKERLLRELDLLKEHHITNLRVMASSEQSVLRASVSPAFQDEPNNVNEQLLEGLDFLLVEMDRRDMRAILVLNNYWQWSGGMVQYINWETGEEIIDPDLTGDWDGFQKQSAKFYANEKCNEIYRNYIKKLVERKNSISGLTYKNDPTIMSWQLSNEPRPAPGANEDEKLETEFVNWVQSTAKYIKSIAPKQLVSSGNEGIAGSRQSREIYEKAHDCEYIDYLTFHIWPKNWGWYNVQNADETFTAAIENTKGYFKEHIEIADKLNKPTVLEEFGLERDNGNFARTSTTNYRDKYLSLLFELVVNSAKEGSPMAGLNFWAWGGEAIASHSDFVWREGDSFMGDPPQEPQGLNSVFSTDSSTLKIFKKYNIEISELTMK